MPQLVAFSGGANYKDASGTVDDSIAKAPQTITWSNPAAINYGTPSSIAQLNATVAGVSGGSAPGVLSYSLSAGTVLDAGSQALSITAAKTTNYSSTRKSVTLVVNPSASNSYVSSEFLAPISQSRAFKQGSTVPIKWQVSDANGNIVTSLSVITSLKVPTARAGTGRSRPIPTA